jgi:DNA-binding FrmR family transcriptional regulator
MSETLLIILSVAEIVALVVVLAAFLLVIAGQLRSIVTTLQEVTWGARAVERQLRAVRPNVSGLNFALEEVASALPGAIAGAERRARAGDGAGGPR